MVANVDRRAHSPFSLQKQENFWSVMNESGNAAMREIKDQPDGQTYGWDMPGFNLYTKMTW